MKKVIIVLLFSPIVTFASTEPVSSKKIVTNTVHSFTCTRTGVASGGYRGRCTNGTTFSGTVTQTCTVTSETCEQAEAAALQCASAGLTTAIANAFLVRKAEVCIGDE